MLLVEYEAKRILAKHGVNIPKGIIYDKNNVHTFPSVIKSQVPIGGRGKAGGIQVVNNKNELQDVAESIKNLSIGGFLPKYIYVEELIEISREFYLSLLINRDTSMIEILANKNGGINVEENTTHDFYRQEIDEDKIDEICNDISKEFGLEKNKINNLIKNLYKCFIDNDSTLLEVNPLILTTDQQIIAGDCKMELDDMALFRHPSWDFENKPQNTNFVSLLPSGNVATIANGAGLAMATVDAVESYGMKPANFLDIGGGANTESVLKAFRQIMEFSNIQAIVINIFAGITRCDEVAKAIVEAKKQIQNLPPLFIRLAGTNYDQAYEILSKENIDLLPSLEDCLEKAKGVIHE